MMKKKENSLDERETGLKKMRLKKETNVWE